MKAQYALLLVLGLPTPGLFADDSGEVPPETVTPPVSRVPQAPGWEPQAATPQAEPLPTVLEYYKSQAYLTAAIGERNQRSAKDGEFKRYWTFKRRLFRYNFAENKKLGIGYYKDADIKGFTTAIILEWD